MKKLLMLVIPIVMLVSACTTDSGVSENMTMEEAGTMLSSLGTDAQALIADVQSADAGSQINDVLSVVSNNTTTVALAATGGEVSAEDLDRLVGSLGDFDTEIDAARDSLDPDLVDRLDTLSNDIRDAVDQLDS